MLPAGLTQEALDAAEAELHPDSLAASTRLRHRFGPDLAAAAVTQVLLRRRARTKFGAAADTMLFTRDGLEQATRPDVAAHHADRLLAAGVRRVVDLGCGIGADAHAFVAAGLEVVAVERDPVTAGIAAYNLAGRAEVVIGDAESLAAELLEPGTAAFCDPARRNAKGRLWRTADFTPSWTFVTTLLAGDRVVGVKLGPGLPRALIPPQVEAEWVSHRGETVEMALWAGPGAMPEARAAMILPGSRLVVNGKAPELEVTRPLRFVYEPNGAVIRAGAVAQLGAQLGASLLDAHIAYLTSDQLVATPYATVFEVRETLPYKEMVLRRWVHEHEVGVLEIKRRGLDFDPAELRKRLRPHGAAAATFIVTRTPDGALVLVAERC